MILAKIQVNTISVHPVNVFALAAVYSREKFVKINLKTYFMVMHCSLLWRHYRCTGLRCLQYTKSRKHHLSDLLVTVY